MAGENLRYEDLDWRAMWKAARARRTWKPKGPRDWDRKAPSFARRNLGSVYVERFLELMRPNPSWSVLDVGCGPGTLALPLARRCARVTALDFSRGMLDILETRARDQGCAGRIRACQASWEDDWEALDIRPHDVLVASRSLSVADLYEGLVKMNRYARCCVFMTDRVGSGPLDPGAFAAVGRDLELGPDYIYTVNMLYSMGIHARVDFIRVEEERVYKDMDEAVAGMAWMLRDITEQERAALAAYVKTLCRDLPDGRVLLRQAHVPVWAFISWEAGGDR